MVNLVSIAIRAHTISYRIQSIAIIVPTSHEEVIPPHYACACHFKSKKDSTLILNNLIE